jgi:cell wall-associated NlpC family hydrolase
VLQELAAEDESLRELLEVAARTIGVRYRWGGTSLDHGIDCSNFVWQLHRAVGRPYDRFYSTRALANLRTSLGLRRISFDEARPGDLLVYGRRGKANRWEGHVVILMDKDGSRTGHRGLVLGAHGGGIDGVQFVTFTGYGEGYFGRPTMRLQNVIRVDDQAVKEPESG